MSERILFAVIIFLFPGKNIREVYLFTVWQHVRSYGYISNRVMGDT